MFAILKKLNVDSWKSVQLVIREKRASLFIEVEMYGNLKCMKLLERKIFMNMKHGKQIKQWKCWNQASSIVNFLTTQEK